MKNKNLPNQKKKKYEIVFSYSAKVIWLRKLLSLELMTAHTLWWNCLFRFSRWGEMKDLIEIDQIVSFEGKKTLKKG